MGSPTEAVRTLILEVMPIAVKMGLEMANECRDALAEIRDNTYYGKQVFVIEQYNRMKGIV